MDDASREFERELSAYLDALGLPPDQARGSGVCIKYAYVQPVRDTCGTVGLPCIVLWRMTNLRGMLMVPQ